MTAKRQGALRQRTHGDPESDCLVAARSVALRVYRCPDWRLAPDQEVDLDRHASTGAGGAGPGSQHARAPERVPVRPVRWLDIELSA